MSTGKDILIIGSGLGGLMCGAILSKEGFRVTVLEKHDRAGGCLQTFRHRDGLFETGFHTLGGFHPGGLVPRMLQWLGVWDRLQPHIVPLDPDGFDHVMLGGRTYRLPTGKDRFVEVLGKAFPHESAHLKAYMDEVWRLCNQIPLYNLEMPDMSGLFGAGMPERTAAGMIGQYVRDPELQALLAWNNTLYAGEKDRTPDFVAALITKMYVEGAVRFRDGTEILSTALQDVISDHGGQVLTGREVTQMEVRDKQVQAVLTADGSRFTADAVISSLHPALTTAMLPEGSLPPAFRNRLQSLRNSCSIFTLFIRFQPGVFPYLNHNLYVYGEGADVWDTALERPGDTPNSMLVITPPRSGSDRFADCMIVHCLMRQEAVEAWRGSEHGRRPAAYDDFKEQLSDAILNRLEVIFPKIKGVIRNHFAATPLTLQHYLSLYEGAVYGTVHDCHNLHASFLSTRTKVSNLFLTGQSVRLHGICGVPVTALETCAQLTGMETLLGHIRETA